MPVFVLGAAVTVGLANAFLYSLISDNSLDSFFVPRVDPWPLLLLYAVCGVFVGVLISGVLLRFAERDLAGSFFARYGLMVASIFSGGAVLALCFTTVTLYFDGGTYGPGSTLGVLGGIAFTAIPGGVLGAVEGTVLGFPLAALLGLFKSRTVAKKDGTFS